MSETQDQAPANFEKALEQLEANVERLENGELSLEDALQAFEKGVAASRACTQWLEQTRQRVQVLMRDAEGDMHLDFLEPDDSEDPS
jgi:exodeoxyribonuclease VII small subunit